jgi:hypothetical protein
MGMYDIINIYKKLLPSYKLMNVKTEWQTKSLNNALQIININKDGIVSTKETEYDGVPINWTLFNKEIEIHTYENGEYFSCLLHIENGKLISIKEL